MKKTSAFFLLASSLTLFAAQALADVSDNEVRIAVVTGMKGISGMGSVVAAEMAAEDMGGKVLGRPVRIIAVDHEEKVERALAEAERVRVEHRVDAFADMIGSNIAIAMQKYATDHNIAALQTTSATPRLTNDLCSPVAVHWNYDSYSLVSGAVRALVDQGLDEWFFVSVDYALGEGLTRAAENALAKAGGRTAGGVKHAFRAADMREQLAAAQVSGAKVIALANAGADTVTAIRSAYELGVIGSEQVVVALVNTVSTIRALDVYVTNGLIFTTGFYWDLDDETRGWSERFIKRQGYVPNMHHASTYSAVLHYLKGVQAAGTDEARSAVAKMREITPSDAVFRNSRVRPDGRMTHDLYLVKVKSPMEVRRAGDYLKLVHTIPPEQAYRPLGESACPLLERTARR